MKLRFEELSFNRLSNKSLIDTGSSFSTKDRFLRMSERGNHTSRRKIEHHYAKKSSGLDFSSFMGSGGKSMNMSQMDNRYRNTMSASVIMTKPIVEEEVNPFDDKDDIENNKKEIEEFVNNFKGKIPLSLIENIDSENSFNKLKNSYKKAENAYDDNFKAKCIHNELNSKMKKLMADLDRAKAERDQINNQLYETKKSFNQKRERINTETMTDKDFKETIEYVETTSNSKPSLDEQIEQMGKNVSYCSAPAEQKMPGGEGYCETCSYYHKVKVTESDTLPPEAALSEMNKDPVTAAGGCVIEEENGGDSNGEEVIKTEQK